MTMWHDVCLPRDETNGECRLKRDGQNKYNKRKGRSEGCDFWLMSDVCE